MTINYLAVLVCGVVSMAIGFVWYGPLFGKAWMKLMGAEHMSTEQKKEMKDKMGIMYLIQFVLSLITAGVLDYYILNLKGIVAVNFALALWFGFVMTTEAGAALWSGKSRKDATRMFLISTSGHFVTFIVLALILSAWK
jgi:hypothetical protein